MRFTVTSDDLGRVGGLLAAYSGAVSLLPIAAGTTAAARAVRDHAKRTASFKNRTVKQRKRAARLRGTTTKVRGLRASIAARRASARFNILLASPSGVLYERGRREHVDAIVVTTGARKRAQNTPRYGYIVERGGRSGRARGKGYLLKAFQETGGQQGVAFLNAAEEEIRKINAELGGPRESMRRKVRTLLEYNQVYIR